MFREKANQSYASHSFSAGGRGSTVTKPRVVNLTEEMVIEETEAILASCNDPVYQRLFAVASERQRLIRYALNRVGNVFVVESSPHLMAQHRARLIEQQPDIHKALYEGMKLLAEVYSEGIYR